MIQFLSSLIRQLRIRKKYPWLFFSLLFNHHLFAHELSPFSNKELQQLEKEFVQQINLSDSVERHPLAIQYINQIGKKLAQSAAMKSPDFFIVKSNEINAFAGPGGHIGINTQLILNSSNESELAGVMAHEIAHVRLHHLYSMLEHQKQMRIPMLASMLASVALGALNPTLGMGAMMGSLSGFSQNSVNFTRSKEKEADRIGIDMLIKAGYNPQGMAAFFKKIQENSRYYYTANIPAILRTHPLDSDRIAEAENRTSHLLHKHYQESIEYPLVKELIRTSSSRNQHDLLNYYQTQCKQDNPAFACQYGHALILVNLNRYQQAKTMLTPLLIQQDNLYYQIAMSQVEMGLHDYQSSLKRLEISKMNYPNNYAVLMAYSQILVANNEYEKAIGILLKASREYKKDLPLCRTLARVQAQAKKTNYAYFTQAQCLLLEGQTRAAVAQLKVAQSLSKNDPYLQARIKAKIEEITN